MRKLSIGIVVESFHTHGGVERRTSELVKGLLNAGHEVHIYANRWEVDAAPGVAFHRVPMLRLGRAMKPLSFAWFGSRLADRPGHDLIHTQARLFSYDVATLGVGCHKAYLEAMGTDPDTAPDRQFHRAVLHIEKRMLSMERFAEGNRIIVNSLKCKTEFMRCYSVPEGSIEIVRNGVDHQAFCPTSRACLREESRRELGLCPEEVAVLFVGSGFERKGLDTLIQASARLRKALPLRLVVIGRGGKDQCARLAADLGISDLLVWAGQSDSQHIARYYAAADVFALPTRYDPFANSTMEALASGLPVVTTTTNGVSEILRDGTDGLVTPPDDPDALAERLSALARDAALRERLGSNGAETVRPYTWQRTTEQTMSVYERTIGDRDRS